MLNFFKELFQKGKDMAENVTDAPAKESGCCGGSKCCGGQDKEPLDLEITESDYDKLALVNEKVVIGKILTIRAHNDPKITKVQVTTCDLGNGVVEQILCGGKNIAVGQIVPVATVGAKLSPDFEIGERDIRGEVSRGMICARQEIGLTEIEAEKGGIWVMPAPLESVLGVSVQDLV